MPSDTPVVVLVACRAMATQFEFLLWGDDEGHLRAAAGEALEEVRRIHSQLSLFDAASDVAEINQLAATGPMRTDPRLIALIERCRELQRLTDGAFDITVGALMRRLGFRGSDEEAPNSVVGMQHVITDAEKNTVSFDCEGVELDFGAIGKGYALDMAADILRECRVGGALLPGGTSSVLAIGTDPQGEPWRVAIRDPLHAESALAIVPLCDGALGVSAPHGRTVTRGGTLMGHVLDPLSGRSASELRVAAVACTSAAVADALSTALLVRGEAFADQLRQLGCRAWTAPASPADG
jgi:thiamine biosynthesis lipoprotein